MCSTSLGLRRHDTGAKAAGHISRLRFTVLCLRYGCLEVSFMERTPSWMVFVGSWEFVLRSSFCVLNIWDVRILELQQCREVVAR